MKSELDLAVERLNQLFKDHQDMAEPDAAEQQLMFDLANGVVDSVAALFDKLGLGFSPRMKVIVATTLLFTAADMPEGPEDEELQTPQAQA